jgi:chromosome segregation ATPase
MHILTLEQKLENLQEQKERLLQKRRNLDDQLRGIENKMIRLKSKSNTSNTNRDQNQSPVQRSNYF